MKKRFALLSLALATVIVVVGFWAAGSDDRSVASLAYNTGSGVVDKTPCEDFTVEIAFKNTGKTKGTWRVNIAFEGKAWTWSGTPKTLTLKPCHKETLIWNGNVTEHAPVGSVARLIVYYNDSFKPLDWWIHIIDSAELTITSSTVKQHTALARLQKLMWNSKQSSAEA